ncbi:NACHT domain-containing protein [Sarocladium implicatum]|nr:NACHT domain-containing protein [Sarocladium implicatum]
MDSSNSKPKSRKLKDIFSRRRREGAEDSSNAPAPNPVNGDSSPSQSSTATHSTPVNLPTRSREHSELLAESGPTTGNAPLAGVPQPNESQIPVARVITQTSLWDRAYEELEQEDTELVQRYKKILLEEAVAQDHQTSQQSAAKSVTTRNDTQPSIQQSQLLSIIERCHERAEVTKQKYTIFGREFDPRDLAAQATELVIKFNGLISEAVKASPEASLAWAGVSIILPLLTNPKTAKEESADGMTYVIARAKYFVLLEPESWPANYDKPGLKEELKSQIVRLYRLLIKFQIRIVVRYHESWMKRALKDTLLWDDWKTMVQEIKIQEQAVQNESKTAYTIAGHALVDATRNEAIMQNAKLQEQTKILQQQLELSREQLNVGSAILATSQETNQLLRQLDLPTIPEAWHESHEFATRDQCWPGTRQRIVDEIINWTEGGSEKPVLWLNGPMGTGKSTVALTVTEELRRRRHLLASFFFFRRGGNERNMILRLLPTLAWQVALISPQFKEALHQSLEGISKDEIEKKSLKRQFEILLKAPFAALTVELAGSLPNVIVVDALDECDDLVCMDTGLGQKPLDDILDMFSELCMEKNSHLRILLTSRSDSAILETMQARNFVRQRNLDDQDLLDDTRADVKTFINERFLKIQRLRRLNADWPAETDLEHLIATANDPEPLFIYAATLILFVEGTSGRKVNPKTQLRKWLAQSDGSNSRLGQIYEPVLSQALGDPEHEDDDADERRQLMLFLGTLCLSAYPLRQEEIAGLLGFESDDVGQWVTSLHAVVDLDDYEKTLRLRHKSFRDFLLGPASAEYHVNEKETHTQLANLCFDQMQSDLKRDICSFGRLDLRSKDVDQNLVRQRISPALEYACKCWIYHLEHGEQLPLGKVLKFLKEHFLHWLEAMSLLQSVPHAVQISAELLDLVKVSEPLLL